MFTKITKALGFIITVLTIYSANCYAANAAPCNCIDADPFAGKPCYELLGKNSEDECKAGCEALNKGPLTPKFGEEPYIKCTGNANGA